MTSVERTDPPARQEEATAVSAADSDLPRRSADPQAALLDRAYTEYMALEESQRPDVATYCARFPSCRSALQRVIEVNRYFGDQSHYLDELPGEPDSTAWPTVGERCGDLTILRLLGRGGFARVFLAAEETTGGRLVAVKFSKDGAAEARTLGRLTHPHVVPVLSAGLEEETGLTITRMPYRGSATLADVLDRVRQSPQARRKATVLLDVLRSRARPEDPPAEPVSRRIQKGTYADGIVHLAAPLAEALAFLHARGVCHRDLKPSNVLLDPSATPLLLDFNLSSSEREAGIRPGGTLHYMPPEQLQACLRKKTPRLDERADLFSFGAIVYELLTGEHPCGPLPEDGNDAALAAFLLERWRAGVPSLRSRGVGVEKPGADVLDRCLAFDPAERPESAAELAAALKRQFTPARRLRRWVAERPRRVLASLAVLVCGAVLAAYVGSITPPYSEREYQRGATAYRRGDYDAAELHFTRAVEARPNDARFRFARGCARLKQSKSLPGNSEKLEQAWADLKPAEQGSLDAPILAVKAYIAGREQNGRTAIRLYNQLTPTGYRPVMVLNNRGLAYLQQKKYKEAEEDLNRAAQLDPNCQSAFYNRALLVLSKRLADPEASITRQALDDVERAVLLGPVTPGLYRDAALLHATAAFDDLRCTPVSLEAPIVPALHFYMRQERTRRALSYLRDAIASGQLLSITEDHRFQRTLGFHPEFAELRRVGAEHLLPPLELRLIDPIDLPD